MENTVKTGLLALLISLFTLAALVPVISRAGAAANRCEEPRPEVCTMEYVPVCATLASGRDKTYSNACSACSDAAVDSWVAGACQE